MEVEDLAEPGREPVTLEQVGDTDRASPDLVLVGGADAASGRAYRVRAAGALACAVQRDVRRQDQRAVRADAQALVDCNALLHQCIRLAEHRIEREHDAVADQAVDARVQDARRDQRENGLDAVDDERVAGVVPALESHDRRGALGQQVDDLPLALVAPLGADDD